MVQSRGLVALVQNSFNMNMNSHFALNIDIMTGLVLSNKSYICLQVRQAEGWCRTSKGDRNAEPIKCHGEAQTT